MTTNFAVVQQLHNTPDLPERDCGAAEAVAAGLRDAKAGNTRWAYSSAWQQFRAWADGTGRLTIQKGKNQVEPQTVAVTAVTARALREIRREDADSAAPVFGLTAETLANRVRAAARTAGLGERFSGHSSRIDMAQSTCSSSTAQPTPTAR